MLAAGQFQLPPQYRSPRQTSRSLVERRAYPPSKTFRQERTPCLDGLRPELPLSRVVAVERTFLQQNYMPVQQEGSCLGETRYFAKPTLDQTMVVLPRPSVLFLHGTARGFTCGNSAHDTITIVICFTEVDQDTACFLIYHGYLHLSDFPSPSCHVD
jgi:hypothetical protein